MLHGHSSGRFSREGASIDCRRKGIGARRAAGRLFRLEQELQLRLDLPGKRNCPVVLERDPGCHGLFLGS